jgi:cell division septation protein DedD
LTDENYSEPIHEPGDDDLYGSSSTSKLAGIFFGVAILCAIFFAIGYRMGKGTAAAAVQPALTSSAPAVNVAKPSAASDEDSEPAPRPAAAVSATPVKQTAPPKPAATHPAPEMAHASAGNFAVQVAAVSRQEDAEALEAALRSKSYPVYVVNNQPGDKLFHVQVGPFSSLADAEAMKARLSSDGYNPILKK